MTAYPRSQFDQGFKLTTEESDATPDFITDTLDKLTRQYMEVEEKFFKEALEKSGLSLEDFIAYYVIEVYPFEYKIDDESAIQFERKFRVRLKTDEELQQEIEAAENEEKNVDSE